MDWNQLIPVLVGVILGAAASLAGTVLVTRWDRARVARLRIYDELLPRIRDETLPAYRKHRSPDAWDDLEKSMAALFRASVVAGRRADHAGRPIRRSWVELRRRHQGATTTDQPDEDRRKLMQQDIEAQTMLEAELAQRLEQFDLWLREDF